MRASILSALDHRAGARDRRCGRRAVALVASSLLALACTGCERTFRDMYDQPRQKPLAASTVWPDGRGSREPVDGTVARAAGTFAGSSAGRRQSPALSPENARAAEALVANAGRVHATTALLARGQERFDIFCSPCHSVAGDGDGMVVRRGFPSPPSFDIDRLRKAPDAYFYDVITHGHGAMYPYAERVPPEDRLAIIAYIRALQLAMRAPVAVVPEAERTKLEASR